MKKILKRIFIIGLISFLLMQLYQPARNSDKGQVLPIHFVKIYAVPNNIQTILQNSCYDCHSNNTQYLWYDYIQPARILVEKHIKEGKENLNFSEWGNYSSRKQQNKLDRIVKQLKADEMPLKSYTVMHRNAVLSATDKQELLNWINTITTTNE